MPYFPSDLAESPSSKDVFQQSWRVFFSFFLFLLLTFHSPNPSRHGRTVSADIFCAEITAGKSQRLKEITTAVGSLNTNFDAGAVYYC
jgi:hypothetical protein